MGWAWEGRGQAGGLSTGEDVEETAASARQSLGRDQALGPEAPPPAKELLEEKEG